MSDILISTPQARATVLAWSRAREAMSVASERLATGKRVTGPFDNVAAFFDAQTLSTRSTNLLQAKENLADAATVTGGTIASIDEIISLLNQAKSIASAAKGGAVSGATSTTVTGSTVSNKNSDVTDTLAGAEDGDSFTITYNGTATTITNTAGSTFSSIGTQIDAISGLTATVSNNSAFVITGADGYDITIADATNNLATDLGLASSTNGVVATNTTRSSAETQFDLILTQITSIAAEASFQGKNLLKTAPDTLEVALNELGGNILSVAGVASTATSLSLTTVDSTEGFATDAGIVTSIAQIDAAISTMNDTRSSISTSDSIIASREKFIDSLVSLVDEGVDKLVGADLDEEAANILALQTRHDLSVTSYGLYFKDGTVLTTLLQLKG